MFKARKADRHKKSRRTSLEIEEEQSRTLYIRVPRTIKNVDEIKNLFFGDFKVKMPRQATRFCHVIFSDMEEKVKNLKAVRQKMIDGKPIFAGPPRPMNLEKKKAPKQKKIKIADPSVDLGIGKYIFVSDIAPGVKASEVKAAFPGSVTVALLKGLNKKGKRTAKVKMSSPNLCLQLIKNKDSWPVLKEHKVSVCLAKKSDKSQSKTEKRIKSGSLKVYDGESEEKEQSEVKDSDSKKVGTTDSDEEDDSEEEEEESEEESASEEE